MENSTSDCLSTYEENVTLCNIELPELVDEKIVNSSSFNDRTSFDVPEAPFIYYVGTNYVDTKSFFMRLFDETFGPYCVKILTSVLVNEIRN
jgi:hypothetical protein